MIKAVIFDLDGVIVDSKKQDYASWKRLFSDHGIKLTYDKYLSLLGMTSKEIVRQNINPNITSEELTKFVRQKIQYFIDEIGKSPLNSIEGLKNLLYTLRENDFKIGLGTSASSYRTNVILGQLGIKEYFDSIVTGDEVGRGKPNPEIYLKVAKKLKMKAEYCVVIEDVPKGILGAKNAGMKCIAITTTHKREELTYADKIIDSFNELTVNILKTM